MFLQPLCFQTPPPPSFPIITATPVPATTKLSGFTQPQLEFYEHKGHLLDLETGQTGIDVAESSEKENSGSSGSLFKEAKLEVPASPYKPHVPIADQLGKEHLHRANSVISPNTTTCNINNNNTNKASPNQISSYQGRPNSLPVESLGHIPPVSSISPPPLPPSPPFNLSLPPPPMTMGMYGKRGASGTVQFAGMSFTNSAREQAEASAKERGRTFSAGGRERDSIREDDEGQDLAEVGEEDDEGSTVPFPKEDRKNLMMEISSVGQTVLKRTNCPRSPGGTPIRTSFMSNLGGHCGTIATLSSNHHLQHSNTDMLQRALLAKFRSLHSTPLRQRHSYQQHDCSGSFDFSSAWSDINSSVQLYEDPDITNTSTSLSGFSPGQTAGIPTNGSNRHNGSTAV